MRQTLLEEVATAILIGDGRDEADEHKISEEHVRSIWNDDDLYTIHYDVDIEAARNELQGTGTASRFGENYIYAEAIITAALPREVQGHRHSRLLLHAASGECDAAGPRHQRSPHLQLQG